MADHDDDVQRLLRAARQQHRSVDEDLQWVWDAAAADPNTPEAHAAFERMASDGRAMLEFGIASALLAERGRRTAAGEASADKVLATIRRQRVQRRRRLTLLVTLAAALLVGAWLWSPAAGVEWEPCEVVRVASRGHDTVALRLRLRSPEPWAPAVFLVEAAPGGVRIDRVHPLAEPLRQSPAFRAWPGLVLPGGRDVVLPPPPFDRLQLASDEGWAFVVHGPEVASDAWVAEVESELRVTLTDRLDDGVAQRAVQRLQQRGWTAQWRRVRAP
jgi:hypothetical protein